MARHKLPDGEAKKTVTLGIKQNKIQEWGGEERLKEKIMEFVESGKKK